MGATWSGPSHLNPNRQRYYTWRFKPVSQSCGKLGCDRYGMGEYLGLCYRHFTQLEQWMKEKDDEGSIESAKG